MQTVTEPVELRTVAEGAAEEAGRLLRDKWRRPSQLDLKGFRDWVTDADYDAQRLITGYVGERFAEHGFLTEEDDPTLVRDGPVLWVIDPLDGTTNFGRRVPTFCVSIAAARRLDSVVSEETEGGYEVVAGAILDPIRNELFSAAKDSAATMNGQPIQVSSTAGLAQAIVGVDWSRNNDLRQAMLEGVVRIADHVHTIRAVGSAALGLAWVAAGRFDAYANMSLGPWDVAAASIIIRQAGGTLTTLNGDPWQIGSQGCLASNSRIHQLIQSRARLSDQV